MSTNPRHTGQHPENGVVLYNAGTQHWHVSCNGTAYANNLFCNLPNPDDYAKGTILRCAECEQFWRANGYAWRKISKRSALRRIRKAKRKQTPRDPLRPPGWPGNQPSTPTPPPAASEPRYPEPPWWRGEPALPAEPPAPECGQ